MKKKNCCRGDDNKPLFLPKHNEELMKENKHIKCEKCDSYISLEQYEENEGVCKKCAKRKYPENCFDPRKDNRSWWTDRQNSYAPRYVPEKVRVLL